ncbi:hypothetical protein IAT40_006902 [Kwoniella sp. CBS 6097]
MSRDTPTFPFTFTFPLLTYPPGARAFNSNLDILHLQQLPPSPLVSIEQPPHTEPPLPRQYHVVPASIASIPYAVDCCAVNIDASENGHDNGNGGYCRADSDTTGRYTGMTTTMRWPERRYEGTGECRTTYNPPA